MKPVQWVLAAVAAAALVIAAGAFFASTSVGSLNCGSPAHAADYSKAEMDAWSSDFSDDLVSTFQGMPMDANSADGVRAAEVACKAKLGDRRVLAGIVAAVGLVFGVAAVASREKQPRGSEMRRRWGAWDGDTAEG